MTADKFSRPETMRSRGNVVKGIMIYYRDLIDAKVMVETGTYHGAMVEKLIRCFEEIMSVELSEECLAIAKTRVERQDRFKRIRGVPPAKTNLVHGNSVDVLPSFLDFLLEPKRPAVFWLDAHYSGGITSKLEEQDCTAMEELIMILDHPSSYNEDPRELLHVILIDDARTMGTRGYPTIAEITSAARERKDNIRVKVEDDIIQISPVTQ